MWKWHRHPQHPSSYYIWDDSKEFSLLLSIMPAEVFLIDFNWKADIGQGRHVNYFSKARDAKAWVEEELGVEVEKSGYKPVEIETYDLGKFKKDFPKIKGLSMFRCVATKRSQKKKCLAHAHNFLDNPKPMWICWFTPNVLPIENNKPSYILLHEYAHLLNLRTRHGEAWQKSYRHLLKKYKYDDAFIERSIRLYKREV